jgi:hypothetical protein
VAAGLIPRLRAGALPGSTRWVDITFKPGERGGDPFLALAYALKAVLGTTGRREVELAEELRIKPDGFASLVGQLLSGSSQAAELLLVVDQFEELFTLVADDARAGFIELIETVVGTPQVRVLATEPILPQMSRRCRHWHSFFKVGGSSCSLRPVFWR